MTRSWTEEEIAAYLDGSLDDESRAAEMAKTLETDRDAQQVAENIRGLNSVLREAYVDPIGDDIPSAISNAINGPEPSATIIRPQFGGRSWLPAAIAATVALVVGLNFDAFTGQTDHEQVATVGFAAAEGALHSALEDRPSGSSAGDGIYPLLTFMDGTGRPCREFEATDDLEDELLFGIACRNPTGRWHVEVVVAAPVPDGASTENGFVPASGAAENVLNSMLDALDAGPTLSPDSEAELLRNDWGITGS